MKTMIQQLPTDVLHLISEYVDQPIYRPIPALSPYMQPQYVFCNPHLTPLVYCFLNEMDTQIKQSDKQSTVNSLDPDIPFDNARQRLLCYLRRLTKNNSPDAFPILQDFIQRYNLHNPIVDQTVIDNLLMYGNKERLEWVLQTLPSLECYQLFEILMNKSDDAFTLFNQLLELDPSILVRMRAHINTSSEYGMKAFRRVLDEPSDKALYLIEKLFWKKLRTNVVWKNMLCTSPHFFRLCHKNDIHFSQGYIVSICSNPSDETIGFLKQYYPIQLETNKVRLDLFRNPNDKVLDYLLEETPQPIPSGAALSELLLSLLNNKNPRVGPFLERCLDKFLLASNNEVENYDDWFISHSWSKCCLPSILKKLKQYPQWIDWTDLSVNPTDEAIDLIEQYPNRVYPQMLCQNPNSRVLPIIISLLDSVQGIEKEDFLESIFSRSDSVEVDKEATLIHRTKYVEQLLS